MLLRVLRQSILAVAVTTDMSFLPVADQADTRLLAALGRIGPVLLQAADAAQGQRLPSYFLSADAPPDAVVDLLDRGADKAVVPPATAYALAGSVAPQRLIISAEFDQAGEIDSTAGYDVLLLCGDRLDTDAVAKFAAQRPRVTVYLSYTGPFDLLTVQRLQQCGVVPLLPTSALTLEPSSDTQLNVCDVFLQRIVSDRPDGLFPTVVSSYLQGGKATGLVYSSRESVAEAIASGRGVYQSRKHGLWRKGETSGDVQDVVSIRLDCDSDALEFSVVQHGAGFCHLGTPSCFGDLRGLAALEKTLQSRLHSAPEGSYTRRLFNDHALLQAKIMEEASELCAAESREDVAFEAADLLYFALTRCVAQGVSLADIERSLDVKAKRVTRRPGHAKPQFIAPQSDTPPPPPPKDDKPLPAPVEADEDSKIRMRSAILSQASEEERRALLRRPVLRSDEMIAKVRPIVDDVRKRGDAALLELTAKFDKAQLPSPVLLPPFDDAAAQLAPEVKAAIDAAYANIRTFHAAQVDGKTLVVETMPGVVCSRFARPVARVGLYVPGGTAVLPSTALMLGIPAQVAGCREIVLATPPRPDGSVVPEVLYVAQLVGASAVLRAGGAQAVAAMAYGTQTVPKVDKIFGPGNQWVTAAKMLVQNDTDALVSIDMPAGPSEVLVIADHTADPRFVAADLLSQAEHGVDSQVVLVAVSLTDEQVAAIEDEVDRQAHLLTRVDIVRESVAKSLIVRVDSVAQALAFSNDYAPEHLIMHLEDAPGAVQLVENAGSVFVGPYTPESCGDYASGTNHTLPTNGYARQFSGVNTLAFQKHITSQEISREGLQGLGPIVATLADCEGLDAHANAVRIRLKAMEEALSS